MVNEIEILKQNVAEKALSYVQDNSILGIGSGSTVNIFIEYLAKSKIFLNGVIAASRTSEMLIKEHGYDILNLNHVDELTYYIDSADEINTNGVMIKGGGAALTREKIIATVAKKFICIVDESKIKNRIGKRPVPIEVIPMARSYVARKIVGLGGNPEYRLGVITDNGNEILDVYGLDLTDSCKMENEINAITGVVENGIFSNRRANTILSARSNSEVVEITIK